MPERAIGLDRKWLSMLFPFWSFPPMPYGFFPHFCVDAFSNWNFDETVNGNLAYDLSNGKTIHADSGLPVGPRHISWKLPYSLILYPLFLIGGQYAGCFPYYLLSLRC